MINSKAEHYRWKVRHAYIDKDDKVEYHKTMDMDKFVTLSGMDPRDVITNSLELPFFLAPFGLVLHRHDHSEYKALVDRTGCIHVEAKLVLDLEPGLPTMRFLSEAMRLTPASQDWGIENSNTFGIKDFTAAFDLYVNSMECPHVIPFIIDLLLSSHNDAMLEGIESSYLEDLQWFIEDHEEEMELELRYWASLEGAEFPISNWLRKTFPALKDPA